MVVNSNVFTKSSSSYIMSQKIRLFIIIWKARVLSISLILALLSCSVKKDASDENGVDRGARALTDNEIEAALKKEKCNEKHMRENFMSWMDAYYPDWTIKRKIVVIPVEDCIYNIRFETVNPHLLEHGVRQKEVIVLRCEYLLKTEKFSAKPVRGVLY